MEANEKDRGIKNKWTDIVMRIQHKSGGITFDSDYAEAADIFFTIEAGHQDWQEESFRHS